MKDKTVFLVNYKRNFIWLDGSITPKVALMFQKALARLNDKAPSYIIFYIRGVGGDPYSAFSMMGDIANSRAPVSVVAHDYVRSGCFLITQAADYRLALKGTKFTFHSAEFDLSEYESAKVKAMTQEEVYGAMHSLRLIDGVQLAWFLKKGRPIKHIISLLLKDATISLGTAKRLKLMDDYYREEDFMKDKRLVNRILKAG